MKLDMSLTNDAGKQEELLVEVARWVTTVDHVAVCELEDN